jgi:phosphotriesterase-related protein
MDVMTVRGPIASTELGVTQPHEHVLIDLTRAPYVWGFDGLLNEPPLMGVELRAFADVGGDTVCDLTTADLGRDPAGLLAASQASGVNVVMSTGWYRSPYYPEAIERTSTAELAAQMVREIEHGVGETGIRPGVIGEIGTDKAWIAGIEERVFRAAARAQAATGLGLMTHTPPGGAPAQLEVLLDGGADPSRIAIGHSDLLLDLEYHQEIRRRGAFVSIDLIGYDFYPEDRRAEHVVRLIRSGHLDWILLSTDICFRSRLRAWGGPGYAQLREDFLPRLSRLGVSAEELRVLTVDNPRRFLTGG